MATTSTWFQKIRRADVLPTFFGWTPGLRRLVAGRVLTCGCLVGVYETHGAAILEVVDACGPACSRADHAPNAVLNRIGVARPA